MSLVPVFTSRFSNEWAEKDSAGMQWLNFTTSTDKGSYNQVAISHAVIQAGGVGLWTALAVQGVKIHPPGKRYVEEYLMAWLTRVNEEQPSQLTLPFGWWKVGNTGAHGFIYAGRLMKDDHTESPSGYGDMVMRSLYSPTGDLDPWLAACKLVTDQKQQALDIIIAAGFAAPLMYFTGQFCPLLSVWGEGGAGKSTAAAVALAIWGNPKKNKEGNATTTKSILQKLGELNNLPLVYDDVKDKEAQKNVLNVVFGSEGTGPGRLNTAIQQQKKSDWQTLIIMCSNRSFQDHIVSTHKTTTAGMMRVFEYGPVMKQPENGPGMINSIDAARITQKLETNYGRMGELYGKMLGMNVAAVDKFTMDTLKDFELSVKPRQDERFWIACCGTILAGAALANKLGCEFDVQAMKTFLVDKYFKLREFVDGSGVQGGTADATSDTLTAFLKNYIANTIWTTTCPTGPGKPALVSVLSYPDTNHPKPIHIQWVTGDRLLRISQAQMRKYLDLNDMPPQAMLNGLREHFGAKTVKARLAPGTQFQLGQESIITIRVPPGSPLEGQLFAHGPVQEERTQVTATVNGGGAAASEVLNQALAKASEDLKVVRQADGDTWCPFCKTAHPGGDTCLGHYP